MTDIVSNSCKIYEDDTKVIKRIRKTHILEDSLIMQDEINKVVAWINTWLMRLNKSKFKIMHIGKKNQGV